jgi:ABC-2 type transport system ATP-binding protein
VSVLLQIENLFGGYLPGKSIIQNVNLSVAPGNMVGLIGLNGAGKSTTIKHILGLLEPHKGTIRIQGKTLEENPLSYRAAYAYVPEQPELYDELTVSEHLELTARAYGVNRTQYLHRVEHLAEAFQMKGKLQQFSWQLSKGMRQKVMLMNAFIVEPSLYIIDEPFLGLDPLAMRALLELMNSCKQKGAGFLVSSHILSTLERYCDSYVLLHEGTILTQGTLEQLRMSSGMPQASLDDVFYALVQGQRGDK